MTRRHEVKARSTPGRKTSFESQSSEFRDDVDDDWYGEPEFDSFEIDAAWPPSSQQKLSARRRLDRFLEQRRLDRQLNDMLDDDDDDSPDDRVRRHRRDRRPRTKLKNTADV